jgi:7-carboxy-7-deazaguanine synthase
VPMVLLRLHGCPVGCPFCDTKETWFVRAKDQRAAIEDALGANSLYAPMSAAEIGAYIVASYGGCEPEQQDSGSTRKTGPAWVLITGGEPGLQPLAEVVSELHPAGYSVAVETSGTADGVLEAGLDWVCVSPKIAMPGGRHVLPEVIAIADEIKMVIGRECDFATLEQLLATANLKQGATISLQPMSQSPAATRLCMDKALKTGWRLSVQLHKYLSIK